MAKGIMIIDGQRVPFDGEKNVLAVIRKAGIDIPTFCYYSELSVHGACRMCMVEDVKTGKLDASCSMEPRDGMEIRTNTAKLLKHRRMILELLLAAHDCSCTTCNKSGNCRLQELAQRFGVRHIRFPNTRPQYEKDNTSYAVFRDPNKCILCGCCVRACSELQGIGVLAFAHRGTDAAVTTAFDRKMAMTNCVSCGQCRVVCPTGALTIHHNMTDVWQALGDKNTRVVAQIAPAVRVAIGEAFGLPKGENSMGKVVAALHRMGFDEVFDTAYTADLTIMEESAEFLERVKAGANLPLMTSCCPAWHSMIEKLFPGEMHKISMTLTPMVFTARMVKKDFPGCKVVFVGPCAAKKLEAIRADIRSDVDFVLTFEELQGMFEAKQIDFDTVEEQDYLNEGTSAGRGFAVSGGVAKAVTDLVHEQYPDMEIQTARAEGLRECRKLMMLAKAGKFKGCLLEGMACPGGCVAGAGTILPVDKAAKLVEKYSREAAAASPVESAYSDRGESLE